jgi:hypothetical protein
MRARNTSPPCSGMSGDGIFLQHVRNILQPIQRSSHCIFIRQFDQSPHSHVGTSLRVLMRLIPATDLPPCGEPAKWTNHWRAPVWSAQGRVMSAYRQPQERRDSWQCGEPILHFGNVPFSPNLDVLAHARGFCHPSSTPTKFRGIQCIHARNTP